MLKIFQREGVRFVYPENWRVEAEDADPAGEIVLHTPDGGFWALQAMPPGASPGECIEMICRGMQDEYDDLEQVEATLEFGDVHWLGCELRFFCLDFLVEARVWACRVEERTLVCHYQADQGEFEKVEPVFQAVTASLFRPDLGNSDTAN